MTTSEFISVSLDRPFSCFPIMARSRRLSSWRLTGDTPKNGRWSYRSSGLARISRSRDRGQARPHATSRQRPAGESEPVCKNVNMGHHVYDNQEQRRPDDERTSWPCLKPMHLKFQPCARWKRRMPSGVCGVTPSAPGPAARRPKPWASRRRRMFSWPGARVSSWNGWANVIPPCPRRCAGRAGRPGTAGRRSSSPSCSAWRWTA
jgi:hypothetical protein